MNFERARQSRIAHQQGRALGRVTFAGKLVEDPKELVRLLADELPDAVVLNTGGDGWYDMSIAIGSDPETPVATIHADVHYGENGERTFQGYCVYDRTGTRNVDDLVRRLKVLLA